MNVTIMLNDYGKLEGFTDADEKHYAKWRASVKAMVPGECLTFSYWFPRNPKFHRYHFAVLKAVYESQEQFDKMDHLRKWLYVGAGFCDLRPGPKGHMVAIPQSIAYDKLDDADFSELHRKVEDFLRSPHARQFLWGHLDDATSMQTVDTLLKEFER